MSAIPAAQTPRMTIETEVPNSVREVKPLAQLDVAVEVRNVNLFYGDKQALYDVSLDIPRSRASRSSAPAAAARARCCAASTA